MRGVDLAPGARADAEAAGGRAQSAALDYGEPSSPGWKERGRWLALSAVPSSLLLGTTAFITTDIASFPLLWVIPLALYLLTFVIAFARPGAGVPTILAGVEMYALIAALLLVLWNVRFPGLWPIAFFCGLLFIVSWACHAELARVRPSARHLTDYYLLMSVGGLLGSAFNVLVAPLLFDTIQEYPIALAAAAFLRPVMGPESERITRPRLIAIAAIVLAITIAASASGSLEDIMTPSGIVVAMAAGLALVLASSTRAAFGAVFASMLLAPALVRLVDPPESLQQVSRSFFGVYRVVASDSQFTRLLHGTTIHGIQAQHPVLRLRPASYYEASGPIGAVLGRRDAIAGSGPNGAREVGLVGLGVGSLACYGEPDERWTFFEIAPEVVRIARDPRYFTYLRDCPPAKEYVLGDARESLRRAAPGQYDALVLDAFSSDAIPVHLMTQEAFEVYLRALAPGGILAVHVSNHYIDLEPVLAAQAMALDLQARVWLDRVESPERRARGWFPSTWIVMARSDAPLDRFARTADWRPLRAPGALWTDDYSNLVGALRW